MKTGLLSRQQFREQVLQRDNYRCVVCKSTVNPVVHHILERRLFDDGGYYISNGATVCEEHHLKCETTEISVEEVRTACRITEIIIPEHLYNDAEHPIDKWGNIILGNGQRLKGELFHDESVQKILKMGRKLDLFTDYVKYPRTLNCPWSASVGKDDRIIKSMQAFEGKRVIVTTKLDGENTNLYSDFIHARSLENKRHPSRDWVKQFWSTIKHDIPEKYRICGENCFAKHSIFYDNLDTYFYGFSIWNEINECLSWDETLDWFELLGIQHVPILYDGIYDESAIKKLWSADKWETMEGYVIRVADKFTYGQFKTHMAKFVRERHVQTVKHWMYGQKMEVNKLSDSRKI